MKCFLILLITLLYSILALTSAHPSGAAVEHRSAAAGEIVHLPFYGGAEGNVLQLLHKPDGTIESTVIRKEDVKGLSQGSFEKNLHDIQEAAAQLVTIQESAKKRGSFSSEDNEFYANNLNQLGVAAQNLAKLQQQGGVQDFRDLFAPTNSDHKDHKLDITKLPPIETQYDHVDTLGGYDSDDSVQVNAPRKDAAVAEAKPVGLAIAGEGGVAQSKPVATAIAGDHGLAIARPVATAIAGVSPDYVSSLGVQGPNKFRKTFLQNQNRDISYDISLLRSDSIKLPNPKLKGSVAKQESQPKIDEPNVMPVALAAVSMDVMSPLVEIEKSPEENSSGATKFTRVAGIEPGVRSALNTNIANRIRNYGLAVPAIQNPLINPAMYNFRNIQPAQNFNNQPNNPYPELIYFI